MNVVGVSFPVPFGPAWAPTLSSRSHGIAPGATKAASEDVAIALAQTALESTESCHVARAVPPSSGLGLRKCVMTWWSPSLNNVACGPTSVQANPEAEGRQT